MNVLTCTLLAGIAGLAIIFLLQWRSSASRHPATRRPSPEELAVGFVSNFLDTLGVGSFPTSTAYFRLRGLLSEPLIPGTLNIGHAPAAIAEALIFMTAVAVDPVLLAMTTAATAFGAWAGAGLVMRLPRRPLLAVLGVGSIIAAVLFCAVNLGWLPGGGTAFALSPLRFGIAVVFIAIFGALMAAGVGFFGPCMILLALLGMHPLAAFPIMMTGGAIQQIVSGLRYLRAGHYAPGTAAGLGMGGIVGVLVAAYLVRSLPVIGLRWLVAGIALYVGLSFLWSARRARSASATLTATS